MQFFDQPIIGSPRILRTEDPSVAGLTDAELEELANPSNPQLRQLVAQRDAAARELAARRSEAEQRAVDEEKRKKQQAKDPGRRLSDGELRSIGEEEFMALRRTVNNASGMPWKALYVFMEICEHLIRTDRFRAAVRLLRDNGFLEEFKSQTIDGGIGQSIRDVAFWFEGDRSPVVASSPAAKQTNGEPGKSGKPGILAKLLKS